jgi:uncharacterized protein (TIGR03067 family)
MCKYLLVVVAVLTLGFAPVSFPKAGSIERNKEVGRKIQGRWVAIYHVGGDGGRAMKPSELLLVVTGNRMLFYAPLTRRSTTAGDYTFRVRAAREPKIVDLKSTQGGSWSTVKGIYRLEGDTFILCIREDEWPTSFEAGELLVFKRKKP